tara:strand:- start:808 stop:1038 length:231 start_codon:yes stop_codon:yes gene_type:complete
MPADWYSGLQTYHSELSNGAFRECSPVEVIKIKIRCLLIRIFPMETRGLDFLTVLLIGLVFGHTKPEVEKYDNGCS